MLMRQHDVFAGVLCKLCNRACLCGLRLMRGVFIIYSSACITCNETCFFMMVSNYVINRYILSFISFTRTTSEEKEWNA